MKVAEEEDVVDTPMDVFRAACPARLTKGLCVLVSTGSLNPVHVGHTRMLELAASHLRQHEGKTVLAAWISVSDASWSASKPFGCMSNEAKLHLAKLAVADHDLIRVSSWEARQAHPVDFPAVLRHVKDLLPGQIEVLYVCGSDHATKCGLESRRSVVIIGREGTRISKECKAFFVPVDGNTPEGEASSTRIRQAIQNDDLESVKHLLHPNVFKELQTRGKEMLGC